MSRLVVHVVGLPAPQGSKRHVGNGVMVESSKKVKPWREAVKYAALDALQGSDRVPDRDWRAPVTVEAVFWLPRPKSHYRTGRNAELLKDAAPMYPSTKPDIDKLLRSSLDALGEAGVWRDDSQVVRVYTVKMYGQRPGACFVIDTGDEDIPSW